MQFAPMSYLSTTRVVGLSKHESRAAYSFGQFGRLIRYVHRAYPSTSGSLARQWPCQARVSLLALQQALASGSQLAPVYARVRSVPIESAIAGFRFIEPGMDCVVIQA